LNRSRNRKEIRCRARDDQLPEPGDYLAFDLLGEPLVLVRGEDARLRVLSNVCRHRYMPVLETGCGRVRSLQCPYHRWSYGLDGRLLGAPDMQRTPGFARGDQALPRTSSSRTTTRPRTSTACRRSCPRAAPGPKGPRGRSSCCTTRPWTAPPCPACS
jgi:nitrite reductase/ring-hydroxylating ferredoxin subunit